MLKTSTTFVGWFALSNLNEQITLLQFRKGEGSPQFLMRFDGADMPKFARWSVCDVSQDAAAVEVQVEEPAMVCAYYDGASIGLSVNGSAWETVSAPAETWIEPGMAFTVADPANGCSCLSLTVYPRILTNAEIASLYQEGA